MSTTPAFDPRRLADLAARYAPAVDAEALPVEAEAPAVEAEAPAVDAEALPVDAAPEAPTGEATEVAATGHPRVDAALAELARAESLPPQDQIAAYESVHRALQETLHSIAQS